MRTGYIYEYLSPSGKYYIGQTINLMQRLSEHRHFKTKGIKMSNETKLKLISTNSVKVIQLSKDGTVLKTWDNIASASRDLSILVTSICNCLSGRSKTAGGYRWIYYGK